MASLSAQTVLQWALEIERNGEAFYRGVASAAQSRDVRALFDDLAYQEGRHFRTFERMLTRAPETAGDTDTQGLYDYLRVALSNALTGSDKGMERAREAVTEEQALKAAMAFEKDTLLFFYEIIESVPASHVPAVRAIIDEEREHLRQLSRVLQDGPFVL